VLPNFGGSLLFICTPFIAETTKFGMVTHMGRGMFEEVTHVIAFAQMHHAVCQQQLSVSSNFSNNVLLPQILSYTNNNLKLNN